MRPNNAQDKLKLRKHASIPSSDDMLCLLSSMRASQPIPRRGAYTQYLDRSSALAAHNMSRSLRADIHKREDQAKLQHGWLCKTARLTGGTPAVGAERTRTALQGTLARCVTLYGGPIQVPLRLSQVPTRRLQGSTGGWMRATSLQARSIVNLALIDAPNLKR